MKAAALGAVVGVTLAASMLMWSCRTERVSDNFTCFDDDDCDSGRICDTGYCVVGNRPADARMIDAEVCPAICATTCNLQTRECPISGTGSGSIQCPPNWNCDITCPTAGACGAIMCSGATSCKVNCASADACLGILCGTADCNIQCTGQNACGNITCTSGDCTATCTGVDACGNLSCTTGNCTETCTGGGGQQVCGSLSCTSTGGCTRTCDGANACNAAMSCSAGPCTETCSGGAAACGAMTCGTVQGANTKCTATCMGLDPACGNVTCNNSCGCDINCDLTTNTCPGTMSCRSTGNGANLKYCSETGVMGTACSFDGSGGVNGCNTCP